MNDGIAGDIIQQMRKMEQAQSQHRRCSRQHHCRRHARVYESDIDDYDFDDEGSSLSSSSSSSPQSAGERFEKSRPIMIEWMYMNSDILDLNHSVVPTATYYVDRLIGASSASSSSSEHDDDVEEEEEESADVVVLISNKKQYQLLCLTALHVAMKLYEEQNEKMLYMEHLLHDLGRDMYTQEDVEDMEWKIISTLNWKLHPPTTNCFLEQYIQVLLDNCCSSNKSQNHDEDVSNDDDIAITECISEIKAHCQLLLHLYTIQYDCNISNGKGVRKTEATSSPSIVAYASILWTVHHLTNTPSSSKNDIDIDEEMLQLFENKKFQSSMQYIAKLLFVKDMKEDYYEQVEDAMMLLAKYQYRHDKKKKIEKRVQQKQYEQEQKQQQQRLQDYDDVDDEAAYVSIVASNKYEEYEYDDDDDDDNTSTTAEDLSNWNSSSASSFGYDLHDSTTTTTAIENDTSIICTNDKTDMQHSSTDNTVVAGGDSGKRRRKSSSSLLSAASSSSSSKFTTKLRRSWTPSSGVIPNKTHSPPPPPQVVPHAVRTSSSSASSSDGSTTTPSSVNSNKKKKKSGMIKKVKTILLR